MHIDDVSRSMEEWLRRAISEVEIAFVTRFQRESGHTADGLPRVEICFQSIEHQKPGRGSLPRDEVFTLAYRLRVSGPDALENQHILSEIYFSARDNADFEVEGLNPRADAGAQRGAEADPDPATLSIIARLVRTGKPEPEYLVTQPLDVRLRSLGRIEGRVVTDAGTPVMLAQIEARALNKRVVSDTAGRFVIAGAPAAGSVSLTVTTRNKSVDVSVDTEKQAEVVIVVPKESEHA